MTRLEWEKAARQDRVRKRGSVSAVAGLPSWHRPKPKPWKTKTGIRYGAKIRSQFAPALEEVRLLPQERRASASIGAIQQLKRIARAERAKLTGPRQKQIHRAVLDRELQRALDSVSRLAAIPRAKRPPGPIKTDNGKRTWRLGSVGPSERSSKITESLRRVEVRGTFTEGRLSVSWDPDARTDKWLLVIRRNGRTVARHELETCEWRGIIGAVAATYAIVVRITGLSGQRPVSWGAAGLSIRDPQKPSAPRSKRRKNESGRGGGARRATR